MHEKHFYRIGKSFILTKQHSICVVERHQKQLLIYWQANRDIQTAAINL